MDDERCLICGSTAYVFRSGLIVVLDWLSLDKVPDAPAGGCEFTAVSTSKPDATVCMCNPGVEHTLS